MSRESDKKKTDLLQIDNGNVKARRIEHLKKCRKESKKTQDEICARLGTSRQSLSDYENGKLLPPTDVLMRMSQIYRESINYLLGMTEYRSQEVEDLGKPLHLSGKAIENILYEGEDHGNNGGSGEPNNQRVFMLDWLLSDREAFTELMDELFGQLYPASLSVPEKIWKKHKWFEIGKNESITVHPSRVLLDYLSKDTPEKSNERISWIFKRFLERLEDNKPKFVAPNEFDPPVSVNMDSYYAALEYNKQLEQKNSQTKNGGDKHE